jgi:hypothetical protein
MGIPSDRTWAIFKFTHIVGMFFVLRRFRFFDKLLSFSGFVFFIGKADSHAIMQRITAMKKRLANLLVVLVTMVTGMFVPATAFADPDQTPGANAEEWTEVSTWADLAAALNSGSRVKLMQDVQKDDYLTVNAGRTSVLDLNGHTINRGRTSGTGYGFVVYVHGGDLTIMDSSAEQTGTITGRW